MKNTLLILLCTTGLFISSCNKATDNNNISTTDGVQFEIAPLNDFNLASDSEGQFGIEIKQTSDVTGNITLSLKGMPSNVAHTLSATEGNAPYFSVLKLTGNYPEQKTYPVTVVATNSAGLEKTADFNLNITPAANCAKRIAGTYNISNTTNTRLIEKDFTKSNSILINEAGTKIQATLSCIDNTLQIDMQENLPNGGRRYVGSGTFVPPNRIDYQYTATTTIFASGAPPGTPPTTYTYDVAVTLTRE